MSLLGSHKRGIIKVPVVGMGGDGVCQRLTLRSASWTLLPISFRRLPGKFSWSTHHLCSEYAAVAGIAHPKGDVGHCEAMDPSDHRC